MDVFNGEVEAQRQSCMFEGGGWMCSRLEGEAVLLVYVNVLLGWLGQMGHIVTAISCFILFPFLFYFQQFIIR
jgi:hypothetical protein